MNSKKIPYISLLSVIEDIHSMASSVDWDEDIMIEWANKGYRSINLESKYEDVVAFIEIDQHTGELPLDMIHAIQAFYKITNPTDSNSLEHAAEVTGLLQSKPFAKQMAHSDEFLAKVIFDDSIFAGYSPLRRSTSSFGVKPCLEDKIPNSGCLHLYEIDMGIIRTTFCKGCVIFAYKRYVKDSKGYDLIPDEENLKQAIFHYCMYRWFMSRAMAKEEGTERIMSFHYNEYKILAAKARGNLMMPDVDQLENIKNMTQRLVPRSNFYDNGFSQMSNRENIDF